MTDVQTSFAEYEALLAEKERELLLQRNRVWTFIDTEHKSKTTKQYQEEVRKSGIEIGDILFSLIHLQEVSDFNDASKALCVRCKSLEVYIRDMSQSLAEDYNEKHKIEDSRKINWVTTVGFIVAIPIGLAAAVKNGVTHGQVTSDTAFEAGAVISTTVAFHKNISRAFSDLGRSICRTPEQIRNSFMLYYLRETIKQNASARISEIATVPSRASSAIKRIAGGQKPKT